MWNTYQTLASRAPNDNGPIVQRMLKLRKQHALLLGYPSFADMSFSSKARQATPQLQAGAGWLVDGQGQSVVTSAACKQQAMRLQHPPAALTACCF
jgi:Peptidase family M3